jgi:hypothetical protein
MTTQYWFSLPQCQAAADPWNVQDVRSGSGTASSVSRHCVSTSKECQNTRGSCYLSANDADFFIATGDNPRAMSGDCLDGLREYLGNPGFTWLEMVTIC